MAGNVSFITELESIIEQRLQQKDDQSYVYGLISSGLDRVLKKVGEEAGEVIIAAKNASSEDFLNESADLLFHLMLVLKAKGHSIEDVIQVLKQRHDR
tara:strand:- start:1851 stop:2144 length:294 start_codon:yes stop_codon:yes gene_type:complete